MSKKTNKTTDTFTAKLAELRNARKELKAKFQKDLDQLFIDYRAAKKKLREQKAELFKKIDAAKKAAKKPVKKVAKKTAKKPAAKKAAPKMTAAEVIAKGEASIAKFKKLAAEKAAA